MNQHDILFTEAIAAIRKIEPEAADLFKAYFSIKDREVRRRIRALVVQIATSSF